MRLGSASIGWFHVAQKGRLGQGLGLMKVCRGLATARHQRRICGTTLTSERGGRSSWRRPGLLRRPPSSESQRWRPLLVPPRSLEPYPSRLSNEPHCSCRRASAQDCTGAVRPIRQPGWLPGAASPRSAHARLAGAEPGVAAPIAWPSTRRLGRRASRCYRRATASCLRYSR